MDEVGSTSSGPTFPRYGEQWFECYICGFQFPLSEARRHYKSKRLVDKNCDDQPTHADFMADTVAPREKEIVVEQPVSCQGQPIQSYWYEGQWYDAEWYQDEDPCAGGSK